MNKREDEKAVMCLCYQLEHIADNYPPLADDLKRAVSKLIKGWHAREAYERFNNKIDARTENSLIEDAEDMCDDLWAPSDLQSTIKYLPAEVETRPEWARNMEVLCFIDDHDQEEEHPCANGEDGGGGNGGKGEDDTKSRAGWKYEIPRSLAACILVRSLQRERMNAESMLQRHIHRASERMALAYSKAIIPLLAYCDIAHPA
ncbi:uncharacterized protein ACA1_362940 [Acanthamoeba castellanii str. Neff]|uniref:Uncharacterized protein n=1 Tax=Acanthamoeba castellanii (strain ATCC 30010 / Neff) TaxID=1257118 RepID=L8GHZ0_ACACF|nr:uncharacterized protein ACA1_362940 [Acanthamoeba castellanii str. Neff]ELR11806.1 hypothetical protein ACA1_362940 [Acanthamoeba castellanii str. Neff]